MNKFKDKIIFFHLDTIINVIRLNIFKHFSLRRFIMTIIVLLIYFVFFLVISPFFLILDEIFFRTYRNVEIKNPVFIVSNPRNGTSHLYKLISLDKRFNTILLYQTVLPSISFIKLMQFISLLDKKIGAPISKFFHSIENRLFKAWDNIHKIDFSREEEDEAFFIFSFFSPTLILICPWIDSMKYLNYLDNAPISVQQRMKRKYINNLKRFAYATEPNKPILMKNVFSSGRIKFIAECFPDAKFIMIFRNPIQAIPSAISMFTSTWSIHSPEIKKDGPEVKAFAHLIMSYYNYLSAFSIAKTDTETTTINYRDLIENPEKTILKIYKQFELEVNQEFKEALKIAALASKKYKSKHHYDLTSYGLNKEYIQAEMSEFMKMYRFT